MVRHRYGQGTVIYAAGSPERSGIHRDIFANMVGLLASPFTARALAPKSVEMTIFHQSDKQRYIIRLTGFQKELPNIPVHDVRVWVKVGERSVANLLRLPGAGVWPYGLANGWLEFVAPRLETLRMFALDYRREE